MRTVVFAALLTSVTIAGAQQLKTRDHAPQHEPTPATAQAATATVPLEVASGTVLKVALDKKIRIRRVGQPVQGTLTEPVYAFDKLVIPVGSKVTGRIASIQTLHTKTRVMSALNADFSPHRDVTLQFDSVRMPNGHTLRLNTAPSAGSLGSLQFVSASDKNGKAAEAKNIAAKKVAELRAQARQEWNTAMHELRDPGKMHRLEYFVLAELPYRPQYLEAGTAYDVRLRSPLEFGGETLPAEELSSIGTLPPSTAMVHAELATALNSADSRKGETVEAVITRPVTVNDRLYIPEGSRLVGKVLQVRPARRLARSGQLRIGFTELVPPSGAAQQIEGALEAFAAAKGDHLTLDSEGGATVHAPSSRFLNTAIAVGLAAASSGDGDARDRLQGRTDAGPSAAGGASGFKAVGMIAGALAHSRVFGTAMGVYGASMSVWSHFLARGRNVVYPEGMSMVIAVGTHRDDAAKKR